MLDEVDPADQLLKALERHQNKTWHLPAGKPHINQTTPSDLAQRPPEFTRG